MHEWNPKTAPTTTNEDFDDSYDTISTTQCLKDKGQHSTNQTLTDHISLESTKSLSTSYIRSQPA
jgi:hypothetical protein